MKRLYVRIKLGYLGEETWHDTNHWVALSTETPSDIAERVAGWVRDTGEELINDDDDDEEGNSDDSN